MAERLRESLRADAQHNRERILEVAREALATSPDASLNSIAKTARVGPGTLYRHFPNRETLILAVYRYDVEQLADAAPKLLADHPPIEALRLWFDWLAHTAMSKHGLAEVLPAVTNDSLTADDEPVTGAMTVLLAACEKDGSIGAGRDPADVLLVLGFLRHLAPGPGAEARAARLLDFVMDGLRAGAPTSAGKRKRARGRGATAAFRTAWPRHWARPARAKASVNPNASAATNVHS
jgi:AcrR family transcriptional regulator